MAGENRAKWLIYHMYDGKCVLDEAESMAQVRAHYAGDQKFENDPIAAVLAPLSEKTLKAYMDQYQVSFDPTKRPALRPYTPPPSARAARP